MADTERPVAAEDIRPTQEMFDLYDQYCHNDIDRRTFMERLGKFAVGGVTVAMLAEALLPKYASALQLAETDSRIRGERITYDSPNGAGKQGKQMGGYLVRPAKPAAAIDNVERRACNPVRHSGERCWHESHFVILACRQRPRPEVVLEAAIVHTCYGTAEAGQLHGQFSAPGRNDQGRSRSFEAVALMNFLKHHAL